MLDKKKKIALFGGSFDPPHYAHMAILEQILKGNYVDELWLMVSNNCLYKNLTPLHHRMQMLNIMLKQRFSDYPQLKLKYFEFDDPVLASQTARLVEYLEKEYPQNLFQFVIGDDNLAILNTWYQYEKLQQREKFFLIYHRPGYPIPKNPPFYAEYMPESKQALSDISSTKIREQAAKKQDLKTYTLPEIEKYIFENKLYADNL